VYQIACSSSSLYSCLISRNARGYKRSEDIDHSQRHSERYSKAIRTSTDTLKFLYGYTIFLAKKNKRAGRAISEAQLPSALPSCFS
jgi:hypothetical protein